MTEDSFTTTEGTFTEGTFTEGPVEEKSLGTQALVAFDNQLRHGIMETLKIFICWSIFTYLFTFLYLWTLEGGSSFNSLNEIFYSITIATTRACSLTPFLINLYSLLRKRHDRDSKPLTSDHWPML